jgi:hypothetical protein
MHGMYRRLATLLLSATLILVGVILPPCAGAASCTMGWNQRTDCCAVKMGISAPRCCNATQQVRGATPATPERSAQKPLSGPVANATPIDPSIGSAAREAFGLRVDSAAAPPDRTLIAQHTSLVL